MYSFHFHFFRYACGISIHLIHPFEIITFERIFFYFFKKVRFLLSFNNFILRLNLKSIKVFFYFIIIIIVIANCQFLFFCFVLFFERYNCQKCQLVRCVWSVLFIWVEIGLTWTSATPGLLKPPIYFGGNILLPPPSSFFLLLLSFNWLQGMD